MQLARFPNQNQSFHKDLRQKINQHFESAKQLPTGNIVLHSKAIFLWSLLILLYVHLVFFTPIPIIALLECIIMGGVVSLIGFNVMHDGAHGSFSKYPWINEVAGMSINLLGANVYLWKSKHNNVHHTFTNIEGLDDDINASFFLRLSPEQKKLKIHKYQHIYFPLVYALLYFFWVFFADFKKYFTGKVGNVPIQKMDFRNHVIFWAFKVIFITLFVGLPIYMVGFVPWLVGFLLFGAFTGVVLSIVFQLAHTVEGTHFPVPDKVTARVEDEWAIHQIKTTANFATQSKLISWLTGGLNFQIEHHLFPNISHVHYPEISKIIRESCDNFGINYLEYPRFRQAVRSHVAHLRILGSN
jgi:linoleoyl-CoA desaturase